MTELVLTRAEQGTYGLIAWHTYGGITMPNASGWLELFQGLARPLSGLTAELCRVPFAPKSWPGAIAHKLESFCYTLPWGQYRPEAVDHTAMRLKEFSFGWVLYTPTGILVRPNEDRLTEMITAQLPVAQTNPEPPVALAMLLVAEMVRLTADMSPTPASLELAP